MESAVTFAETGHLCLCTLHANNANQALDRIIHFFPSDRHDQIWMDLSLNLKAIVAQQLIPTVDGQGRRAAVEVLINTPLDVGPHPQGRSASAQGADDEVDGARACRRSTRRSIGCTPTGEITYDAALAHADSPNDLRLMIKLGADARSARSVERASRQSDARGHGVRVHAIGADP